MKYEADLTRNARDMGYVEKQVVFRTPCTSNCATDIGYYDTSGDWQMRHIFQKALLFRNVFGCFPSWQQGIIVTLISRPQSHKLTSSVCKQTSENHVQSQLLYSDV